MSYILNALVMWFAPQFWYDTVPGITEMGLYHKHLIRDVGLAYGIMGAGLLWAGRNPSVAIFACLWPAAHALYHAAIFFGRGMQWTVFQPRIYCSSRFPHGLAYGRHGQLRKRQCIDRKRSCFHSAYIDIIQNIPANLPWK